MVRENTGKSSQKRKRDETEGSGKEGANKPKKKKNSIRSAEAISDGSKDGEAPPPPYAEKGPTNSSEISQEPASQSAPGAEAGYKVVPLSREEEINAAFLEEGVIELAFKNPGQEVARYLALAEEIETPAEDYTARAEIGEKALRNLAEEVEGFNSRTIQELKPLNPDQKHPGVFMLMKVTCERCFFSYCAHIS